MSAYIIISGGRVDDETLEGILSRHLDDSCVIAVDKGLDACNRLDIVPDIIVGDFDSADASVVDTYRKKAKKDDSVRFLNLDVHKDYTDTHVALRYALDNGATDIYIACATGTRMDHTMANMGLLKECTDRKIHAYIEDDHNVITMISSSATLGPIEGYDYVSLIPYGGPVTGVSLTGFEYNVRNVVFDIGDSLGVSNRIVEETARVELKSGYMMVIYSRD